MDQPPLIDPQPIERRWTLAGRVTHRVTDRDGCWELGLSRGDASGDPTLCRPFTADMARLLHDEVNLLDYVRLTLVSRYDQHRIVGFERIDPWQ